MSFSLSEDAWRTREAGHIGICRRATAKRYAVLLYRQRYQFRCEENARSRHA